MNYPEDPILFSAGSTPRAAQELPPGVAVPDGWRGSWLDFPGGICEHRKAGQFPGSSLTAAQATQELLGLHHQGRGPFDTISPGAVDLQGKEPGECLRVAGVHLSLPAAMGIGARVRVEQAYVKMSVWGGRKAGSVCESLNKCVCVHVCGEHPRERACNEGDFNHPGSPAAEWEGAERG